MSNNNTAEQQPTEKEQVAAFVDGIINAAAANNLGYSVVFNALSQVVSSFVFDFVIEANDGAIVPEKMTEVLSRFYRQTSDFTALCLKNIQDRPQEPVASRIITAL